MMDAGVLKKILYLSVGIFQYIRNKIWFLNKQLQAWVTTPNFDVLHDKFIMFLLK